MCANISFIYCFIGCHRRQACAHNCGGTAAAAKIAFDFFFIKEHKCKEMPYNGVSSTFHSLHVHEIIPLMQQCRAQ